MSGIYLQEMAEQTAPSSGAILHVGADARPKAKLSTGESLVLSDLRAGNLLINGGFSFAQRQAPATLTTYSNTSNRVFGADRWGMTNENASLQYARVDTASAPETGLSARFYGQIKKITSAGKMIVSQALEGSDVMPLRGRRVRVQFKARNGTGSHTLRLVLLQLTAAGTLDSIPGAFVSAFGAAGVDPTWGTNLSAVTPDLANASSSISGSGLSCILSGSWTRFGGVFTVPTDCKNLIVAIFTNGLPAADDWFGLSECALHDGDDERDWLPPSISLELLRCQRYCSKTFADPAIVAGDAPPVQNPGTQTGEFRYPALSAGATVHRPLNLIFPVWMRAAPTITLYNPAATNAQFRDTTNNLDCSVSSAVTITARGCGFLTTGNAGTTIGSILAVHILAEAEL